MKNIADATISLGLVCLNNSLLIEYVKVKFLRKLCCKATNNKQDESFTRYMEYIRILL